MAAAATAAAALLLLLPLLFDRDSDDRSVVLEMARMPPSVPSVPPSVLPRDGLPRDGLPRGGLPLGVVPRLEDLDGEE